MKRHVRSVLCRAMGVLCLSLAAGSQAAPGSWVGETESVRLFTPGRVVTSSPLIPVGAIGPDAVIRNVSWRFRVPAGQPRPQAWLCAARECTRLGAARGSNRALAGLAANQPLHFRFRLPEGGRPINPFRITGLQVIVDYQTKTDGDS